MFKTKKYEATVTDPASTGGPVLGSYEFRELANYIRKKKLNELWYDYYRPLIKSCNKKKLLI